MTARILTSEQIDALAALDVTRWYAHRRAWGDGSPVGTLHVRGDSLARQEACAELLAAAPDLLATVKDLQRRLTAREDVLSDAGADLHEITEEARALGPDAPVDELRAFVGMLADVYASAAGRKVAAERDALQAKVAQLQGEHDALLRLHAAERDYGREHALRLTRERDALADGCCVECGGTGVGPDARDVGDHFTPSCPSCGGTGMSPTVRRLVKERDEARGEIERLRAALREERAKSEALEDRASTLAEANLAHLHATPQDRARRT